MYPHRVRTPDANSAFRTLFCLGLALVVLFPGWLTGGTRLIGDEALDVWSHAWGIRWVFNHISDGTLPWDVSGLAWPRGGTLWYIDPLGALTSLPAQWLGGAVWAHNSILFFQVMLAASAAMAFARGLGGRGWVAAVALATAPTFLADIHNGTIEACWIGLVPLAGAAAIRCRWWGGVAVGVAGLATPYHGISAALVVATVLLFRPHTDSERTWRERLLDTAIAAAMAALIALPALLALKANLDDPMSIAKKSAVMLNFSVLRGSAVDPLALIRPGDFWSVHLNGPLTTPFRRTPYLGLGLLTLSAWTLFHHRRTRPWIIPITIAAILALGPFLWHNGDFVRDGNGDLMALPFRALLGLGVAMDHPLRFICGAVTVLAVLGDVATRKLEHRVGLPVIAWTSIVGFLLAFEHLSLAPNVWPLNTADGTVPAVYADLEDEGAVIDLPASRGESIATNRYLYWQGIHRRPIPYAHKVGPDLSNLNPALRAWAKLSRSDPFRPDEPGPAPSNAVDLERHIKSLSTDGFRWVVVHPELCASEKIREAHIQVLEQSLGPAVQQGEAWVYDLKARP